LPRSPSGGGGGGGQGDGDQPMAVAAALPRFRGHPQTYRIERGKDVTMTCVVDNLGENPTSSVPSIHSFTFLFFYSQIQLIQHYLQNTYCTSKNKLFHYALSIPLDGKQFFTITYPYLHCTK